MTDDLVRKLREPWFTNGCERYQLDAADRIEALTAELEAARLNYLHLNTAAYDVWRWFEVARPDLIGHRAEALRDVLMGPAPYDAALNTGKESSK